MRMWGVDPALLCQKHLLGEHVEMHMFVGTHNKGVSMAGYIEGGLVETGFIGERHDQLAAEMIARGLRHKSPLQELLYPIEPAGRVDVAANQRELIRRCPECASRFQKVVAGK